MNVCAKTIKASGLKLVPLLEKIRDVPEVLFAGVFVRFFYCQSCSLNKPPFQDNFVTNRTTGI